MNKLLTILTIFISVIITSSCDLFNPQAYNDAITAYNNSSNSLYGNYWSRLYYSGPDISSGDNSVVVGNTYYALTNDEEDTTELDFNYEFQRVDLTTLVSSSLTVPDAAPFGTNGYTTTDFGLKTAGGEIFLALKTEINGNDGAAADDTAIFIYRYNTADNSWESGIDTSGIDTDDFQHSDIFERSGVVYLHLIYQDGILDSSKTAVYKFNTTTKMFELTDSVTAATAIYTEVDLITTNSSFADLNQYNFTTDTFSAIAFTDSRDPTIYDDDSGYTNSDFFLTESLILGRLYQDWTATSAGEFSPLVVEYIDLGGDQTIRQVQYTDFNSIGYYLKTALHDGSIYLTSSRYDASTEDDITTDKNIYLLDFTDMSLSVFGAIPGSEKSNFISGEIFLNELGMIEAEISCNELFYQGFPYNYIFNPTTGAWMQIGYTIEMFGVKWATPINDGAVDSGLFYMPADFAVTTIDNCLLRYTPPVF
jgi:hypothetical protein